MSRTRAVFSALSLILVLFVAGCSDDDPKPKFAPPSSEAPPSTSTTSDPTDPNMPAAARQRSDAGADAFVHYFVDVLNHAQETGDTALLSDLSSPQCRGCTGYLNAIVAAYGSGGRVEGGELRIGKLRRLPNDYGSDWGGFGRGTATAQVIIDGSGSEKSYAGGAFSMYAYTKWRDDSWTMQWIRTPS